MKKNLAVERLLSKRCATVERATQEKKEEECNNMEINKNIKTIENELSREDEEWFDNFVDFLKDMKSKATGEFKVVPARLEEFGKACILISKAIKSGDSRAEISYHINECDTGEGVIRVEADDIVIRDIQAFTQGIATANNFVVYPLITERVRFAAMFNGILKYEDAKK